MSRLMEKGESIELDAKLRRKNLKTALVLGIIVALIVITFVAKNWE